MHGLLSNHGKNKWNYINSLLTNPVNCVITSRETTCYSSSWKQEFIVLSLWNMSRVYKQGRKKIKLKHQISFLPSEDDPCSFCYPMSIFHSISSEDICFMSCYFLKFHWFIFCIVQWLKYVTLIFPGLDSSCSLYSPRKGLVMVYLLGGRSYLLLCFLLHVFLCISQSQMIFHFSFLTFKISQPAKAMSEVCYFPIGFGN